MGAYLFFSLLSILQLQHFTHNMKKRKSPLDIFALTDGGKTDVRAPFFSPNNRVSYTTCFFALLTSIVSSPIEC